MLRICKRCGLTKSLNEFPAHKSSRDGHCQPCRACAKAEKRAYHQANKDRINANIRTKRVRKRPLPPPASLPGHMVCRRCLREQPLDGFELHPSRTNPLYRIPTCLECLRVARNAAYAAAHPPKPPPPPRTEKRCGVCGIVKPMEAFHYQRTAKNPDQRFYACRSCRSQLRTAQLQAMKATDPEKVRAEGRRRRQRYLHYDRQYHRTHRPQINANKRRVKYANLEKHRAYQREYNNMRYTTDPGWRRRVLAQYQRRRAIMYKSAQAELIFLDNIFKRDKGICGLCHTRVVRSEASLDHIIPLSQGGMHTHINVQLAHRSCNSRKGNRHGVFSSQLRLLP